MQNKISEKEGIENFFANITSELSIQYVSMLDAFAKEGNWLSKHFASKFSQIDAVDICDYADTYKKNIEHPNAKFHVMNNIEYISNCNKTYDLILLDSPMGDFGGQSAEHFGIMEQIVPLTQPGGSTILIFNTSLEPYDYDAKKNQNWKAIRNKFYGKNDTSKMSSQFYITFYINYFRTLGLTVTHYDMFARRSTQAGDKTSIDLNLVIVKK